MNRRRTIREEANALTCHAFRNVNLEDLHAGEHSELLENPKFSRITDAEMKELMIQSSAVLAKVLLMKETNPDQYWAFIDLMCKTYVRQWDKTEPHL